MRYLVSLSLIFAALLPAQYTRRRGPVAATATSGPSAAPAVTFNGTVKSVSKKELTLELDRQDPGAEKETLTFRLTKKTKYLKGDQAVQFSDIAVGAHLSLDATREGDQKLSAVDVILPTAAKPADPAKH